MFRHLVRRRSRCPFPPLDGASTSTQIRSPAPGINQQQIGGEGGVCGRTDLRAKTTAAEEIGSEYDHGGVHRLAFAVVHEAQAVPLREGEEGQSLFMQKVAAPLRQPDQGHTGIVVAIDADGALFDQAPLRHAFPETLDDAVIL